MGAKRELFILLNDLNQTNLIENSLIKDVTWKFNRPSNPWMGSFWESVVKLTKPSLKSVLKDRPVYEESLRTFLIVIEFTFNSHLLLPLMTLMI